MPTIGPFISSSDAIQTMALEAIFLHADAGECKANRPVSEPAYWDYSMAQANDHIKLATRIFAAATAEANYNAAVGAQT